MVKFRQGIILLLSAAFIGFTFFNDYKQLIYLLAYIVIETGISFGYLFVRKKFGKKPYQYVMAIVLALAPLFLCKLSGVFPITLFNFLGISYLTFRVLQVVIEIYDGVIEELKLSEFLAYLLFFSTLECGPIDRSRRFSDDWNKRYTKSEYLELLGIGIEKILLGIVYKVVISALIYPLLGIISSYFEWWSIIAYAYCYGIYMFFEFAGASSIAIGIGYILGVRVPENFNKPFISKDMKDFWNRWHMSLSFWFRDFVFSRFVMRCIKKKWFSSRLTIACMAYIINMLVMGAWHGLKPDYLLYGLYHGLLLAGTEIYQKKSKIYKKYKKSKVYNIISWAITMNLVMFGFLIFSGRFLEIIRYVLGF